MKALLLATLLALTPLAVQAEEEKHYTQYLVISSTGSIYISYQQSAAFDPDICFLMSATGSTNCYFIGEAQVAENGVVFAPLIPLVAQP